MANPEHVEIVKAGAEAIATARTADRSFTFDLSAANLQGAFLLRTLLNTTDLQEANLKGSHWAGTVIGNTDFTSVTTLADAVHYGPSSLGVDTLERNPKLPEAFLRGCGVPEHWIEYIPSLVGKVFDFYSCFISYSHEDKQFARQLHDRLQGKGIRCWLDEHELKPGDDIYRGVDRGIRVWDKVLLCCSESALNSWWVGRELDTAIEREEQFHKQHGTEILKIIPLNLDGSLFDWTGEHAAVIRKRMAADFTDWKSDADKFEREFEKVVKALRTDGGRPEPVPKLGR